MSDEATPGRSGSVTVRPLLAPRDWQAMALREAAELTGTPEGAARLAESKRYGALADEIERLRAQLAKCGKDNCLGRLSSEVTNWVTVEARDAAEAAERERWRAAVTLGHLYAGACPDDEQPDSRDEHCPLCVMLGPNAALTGPQGRSPQRSG